MGHSNVDLAYLFGLVLAGVGIMCSYLPKALSKLEKLVLDLDRLVDRLEALGAHVGALVRRRGFYWGLVVPGVLCILVGLYFGSRIYTS
jgi:hypothetical protein